jgi:hypothetical protein
MVESHVSIIFFYNMLIFKFKFIMFELDVNCTLPIPPNRYGVMEKQRDASALV